MELILNRIAKRKGYTIGRLSITPLQLPRGGESEASPRGGLEGVYFCDTLEPTWRDYRHGGRKIKGRSAIPEGRYPVVITWSPKMKQWLPLLVNVPMFSGIRIHAGNPRGEYGRGYAGVHPGGTEPEERHGAELAHLAETAQG